MRFLSENRTSLVVQPDRNRIIRDLSENRTNTRQDLSENQTSFVSGQDTRLVRKQDGTRQDLSENQTSFGSYKEGNKKKKEKACMPACRKGGQNCSSVNAPDAVGLQD